MKTFFFAALFAALCIYSVGVQGVERTVSPPTDDVPAIHSGEKYYAIFLAHQSADNTIAMSHTFAMFLRTEEAAGQRKIVETAVINWLPASGQISVVRPAELGVNKSIDETLAWARDRDLEISVIGPFEIDADFFRVAKAQAARLDKGELRYRCFDVRFRATAKNCVHAVSDMFPDEPKLETGSSRGLDATLKVVDYFRPRFKSAELTGIESAPLLTAVKLNDVPRRMFDVTAAAE